MTTWDIDDDRGATTQHSIFAVVNSLRVASGSPLPWRALPRTVRRAQEGSTALWWDINTHLGGNPTCSGAPL
jgi:hypothetical protein